MNSPKYSSCPITGDTESQLVFDYDSPPKGEISFVRFEKSQYRREIWQFQPGRHFVSTHSMQVATAYDGDYVKATYRDSASMAATFERIIALPPEKSDNVGRFGAISNFAGGWFVTGHVPNLLDVGSGLGVFPHVVHLAGWQCTAIDPDPRAVEHLTFRVGVDGLCGDFMQLSPTERYDIITLNKVLEHVEDPVAMLERVHDWLAPNGFVYVEVPDGEVAYHDGPDREEFFIEHLHIFSLASTAIMASRAGFLVQKIHRLQEPSTKYTLRAFLS